MCRDRPDRESLLEVLHKYMLNVVSQIRSVVHNVPTNVSALPSPQVFRYWQLELEHAAAAAAAAIARSGGAPTSKQVKLLRDTFLTCWNFFYLPALRCNILHGCQVLEVGSGVALKCRHPACFNPACKSNRLEVLEATYEGLHIRGLERKKQAMSVHDFFGATLGSIQQSGGVVLDIPGSSTAKTKVLQLHMVHHKNEACLRRNGRAHTITVTLPHSLAVITHNYLRHARPVLAAAAAPEHQHLLLMTDQGKPVDHVSGNAMWKSAQVTYKAPWAKPLTPRQNRHFYCCVRMRDLLEELRCLPSHVGLEADAYVLGNSFNTIVSHYTDAGTQLAGAAVQRLAERRRAIEEDLDLYLDVESDFEVDEEAL